MKFCFGLLESISYLRNKFRTSKKPIWKFWWVFLPTRSRVSSGTEPISTLSFHSGLNFIPLRDNFHSSDRALVRFYRFHYIRYNVMILLYSIMMANCHWWNNTISITHTDNLFVIVFFLKGVRKTLAKFPNSLHA